MKKYINYKNFKLITKSINSYYRIKSSRLNKLNKICQNKLKKYIKYYKYLGLIPYILKNKVFF
ncbi:30S ribosomal protein S18 [Candidatus Nasuia deltocephalinicola]|nr:30S ribosomal protein S18 [Candidatus Nasuia deltocephalinicola]